MLFKKPSIFVFKKKLNVPNSLSTKYVKSFKIQNFNNDQQINLLLTKLNVPLHLFNQKLKKKTSLFRKILLKKWNVKKHFKMKLFARSSIFSTYKPRNTRPSNPNNVISFAWKTTNIISNSNNLHNRQLFFGITNDNRYYPLLPINVIYSYNNLNSSYLWLNIIQKLYDINIINFLNIATLNQLTKHLYWNNTSSQLNNLNFFCLQRLNLIQRDMKVNTTHNMLPETTVKTDLNALHLFQKTPLTKLFSILSKYLPHINLVRLFRRTKNKKTLSYNIDKDLFFKSTLIRINLDYKFYTLNTLKSSKRTITPINKFSLFIRGLSNDNLLEKNFDSSLNSAHISSNDYIFTTRKLQLSLQIQNNNNGNFFLPKLANLNLISFDFLNVQTIINNPLLYKYIFWLITPNNNLTDAFNSSLTSLNNHYFSSRINLFKTTNLWPSSSFHFTLKRKILKIFSFNKFLPNVTMWYYNILIRFMESCTGKKVFLKFNPFIENLLSFTDIARCNMWSIRISSFQRLLGPKIFLNESLRIMHIALRFKDPTFFANWIKGMLNRMSFWKYRLLFRYIKFAMRYLFWLYFSELQFKGLKIKLKGKISVAGNARTRTLVYRIGETGYSKIDNRVLCDSSTINTFTGVLGFKIWFFF